MLSADKICKSYGGNRVLSDVSLSVERERVSVLIGPSGSGKSTLVRNLSLLEIPDSGDVVIDSNRYAFPMQASGSIAPWPDVTVVFQQHFLWPHLTLQENVLLPCARRPGCVDVAEHLQDVFGVREILSRYPNEVSMGQCQRVALIRALALQPRYILLDEITAALDVEQTGEILRYFLETSASGMGILLVTHLLGFARRLLDVRSGGNVYFLDEGRIVEYGTSEILTQPRSERLARFLDAEKVLRRSPGNV